jgi:hypothetical protein
MKGRRLFQISIRDIPGKQIKPAARAIDGQRYYFSCGWVMNTDDKYPGEIAWIADDPKYPMEAPIWLASGDLVPV